MSPSSIPIAQPTLSHHLKKLRDAGNVDGLTRRLDIIGVPLSTL